MKKLLSIILSVAILSSIMVFPAFAENEDAVLTIVPNITSVDVSENAVDVIYTVTLTPKAGVKIGAFSVKLNPAADMTLAETEVMEQGGDGFWINFDLMYIPRFQPNGIFETAYEYAPAIKTLNAAGGTESRAMTEEAVVMTIKATIAGGKAGEFALDADLTVADPLGNGIANVKVISTPVTIAAAHTHIWGTEWASDGDGHWLTCTGCGEADVKAAHTGGTATCSAKAVCEVCGAEYGEVNAENHGETEVRNAVEATCGTPGYTGDTFCKACSVKIADGTAILPTGAHTGGTATCVAKAVCEVCGAEYGEVNAENHGETEVKNAVEATETTPGYTGDVHCKDCGALIEKGQEIPATGGEEPVTMGDVNGDGKINNIDAMRILQYYVGMADDINAAAADVSGDGKINNVDAMLVLQYYVGLITKFPAA